MPAPTYSTTGTVSSPLNLDSLVVPKGEHDSVRLNGSSSKKIRPKPKVTLTSLTVNNSGTLRKINSVVIPIVYSDKFYKDILDPTLDETNKLVYYGDIPVGAICCRIENLSSLNKEKPPTLVILTLAKPIKRAMAHVQVGNDGAKRFYERLGFVAGETVADYYSKMEPRGAVLM
ncbi:MAG: hypothetical protein TREMPRED_005093, partial [Tremellales sp. Tagirdzhanova-0007]